MNIDQGPKIAPTLSIYFPDDSDLGHFSHQNIFKIMDSRDSHAAVYDHDTQEDNSTNPKNIKPDESFLLLRLQKTFFSVPCETLAQSLLGKVLVRQLDNGCVLKGRIVETECYLGGEDKASHSYGGRRTERNAPMYMDPGTSYVYLTYGMYHCFNISSQGDGAAVLVRALEPLEGLETMAELRLRGPGVGAKRPLKKRALKPEELCSGPSKLCLAMAIDRDSCNKRDLCSWPGLCVAPEQGGPQGDSNPDPQSIVVTQRIGIASAGAEWAGKPLRFYLRGNRFVSKRDKAKEEEMATPR